mmetsp:Transcript_10441/g.9221  ORF Transcript_10441/g.9221 Transcript_10441/m.9221 type:complete len:136 (+) Transcript_10441:565-972(+)
MELENPMKYNSEIDVLRLKLTDTDLDTLFVHNPFKAKRLLIQAPQFSKAKGLEYDTNSEIPEDERWLLNHLQYTEYVEYLHLMIPQTSSNFLEEVLKSKNQLVNLKELALQYDFESVETMKSTIRIMSDQSYCST